MVKREKMPTRVRIGLVWTLLGVLGFAYLMAPWADLVATILVLGIAPPATLFAVVYGFTVSWWETTIGRAMLISSTGLALLVDISLVYKWLGDDYALRDVVRLFVFALVFLGACYKFAALVREKWLVRRGERLR